MTRLTFIDMLGEQLKVLCFGDVTSVYLGDHALLTFTGHTERARTKEAKSARGTIFLKLVELFDEADDPLCPNPFFPGREAQPGVCAVCGCTDDAGCPEGCTWVNRGHTICSECARELSVVARRGRESR